VVVWAVVAAFMARSRLDAVRADLRAVLATRDHDSSTLLRRIDRDTTQLRSAERLLHGWGPRLVAATPVAGRSLVAERTVARASLSVLTSAAPLLHDVDGLGTSGGVDLARLSGLGEDLRRAAARTDRPTGALARLRTGLTPPVVGHAVVEARTELLGLPAALRQTAAATDALASLLGADGPRTLLLALQNNAELRGTGGLIGAVAFGHTDQGRLHVDPFRDVADTLSVAPGFDRTVPAPSAYLRTYSRFRANTTIWTNANFSPQVPDSALVLSRLAEVSLHRAPDAVVLIDVPAVSALLDAAGERVRLPGVGEVSGDALTYDLLVSSYGPATDDARVQSRRRAALEQAAGAVLGRVLAEPPTLRLLRTLADLGAGRHITVWSGDDRVQGLLTRAGVSGAVAAAGGDVAMATVDNLGDSPTFGNKLDYYVQRRLTVDVVLRRREAQVTQTLRLHNAAPDGLGPYVAGRAHPGRVAELVGMAFPRGATVTGLAVDGQPGQGDRGEVGDAQQVLTEVVVARGATVTITLGYRLPLNAGRYRLTAIPQPLVYPAGLIVHVREAAGTDGWRPAPDVDRPWTATQVIDVRHN
jgi:hypothetical protein